MQRQRNPFGTLTDCCPLPPAPRPALQVVEYDSITSMYGAVHCSSQVVHRIPRAAYGQD